jgi:hypothetical protein
LTVCCGNKQSVYVSDLSKGIPILRFGKGKDRMKVFLLVFIFSHSGNKTN